MLSRVAEAQQQGLTEEKLSKVSNFEASDLTEREKAALRFAELLVLNPKAIDDALMEDLKIHFAEAQIVELAFAVMVFNGLHRFNVAIDLEPVHPDGLRLTSVSGLPGT
ncbi:MAG: carboxymuconolactone decarboxylase family protein [Chloroflexi bacterium]|nr:carboxymuconolactone decarboxylase family protein [Chloroflexota bacterium]